MPLPFVFGAQAGVQIFEGPEEADERMLEVRRAFSGLLEIAMPELVRPRNDRRSHRAVFVRTLCPGQFACRIDP